MNDVYLTDLADWLRAAGLTVVEYPDWRTRARGSGGFDGGRPWCVAWHHTASSADVADDAAYCAEGDPDAPVCNVLVARDGAVWIIAGGASNTNGKGYAMTFSRGTVPDDQMNTHAVGMEICSDGIGEIYSAAQIDAACLVSLTITGRLGLDPTDVTTHAAWAPDRKIDPATAAAATGLDVRSINSSGTWNLDDLRAELAARAGGYSPPDPNPTPPPNPTPADPEGEHMLICALDEQGTAWVGDGVARLALTDPAVFERYILVHGARFVNVSNGVVRGWGDVGVADGVTLAALGKET